MVIFLSRFIQRKEFICYLFYVFEKANFNRKSSNAMKINIKYKTNEQSQPKSIGLSKTRNKLEVLSQLDISPK